MGSLLCLGAQDIRRPGFGGPRSVAGSLRALAAAGEELVYLIPHAEDFDEELAPGLRVCSVVMPPREGPRALWRSLRLGLPYKFAKYHSQALARRAEELARQRNCDWVLLHCPHVGGIGLQLKARLGLPVFLREHNVEYQLVEMYAQQLTPWLRPVAAWQRHRTLSTEQALWRTLDGVFMISDSDYALASRHSARARLIYDGVDVPAAAADADSAPAGSFLFSAGLDVWQNRRSLRWFAREVWLPFVEALPPGRVSLDVIGAAPDRLAAVIGLSPAQLRRASIELLGVVDDFGAVVRGHAFFVSATLQGSGYRVKIAEAGAAGTCLLLTPLDLTSLAFLSDGGNCRCFADAEAFAAAAGPLLDDERRRRAMAEALSSTLGEHMSWDAHAAAMLRAVSVAR